MPSSSSFDKLLAATVVATMIGLALASATDGWSAWAALVPLIGLFCVPWPTPEDPRYRRRYRSGDDA
jgi:hypothetical protein